MSTSTPGPCHFHQGFGFWPSLNALIDFRISIGLFMFTNNTNIPSLSPLNFSPQQRQSLPDMNNLTNDARFDALRHRTEISELEVATHAAEGEFAGFGHAQEDCC